jgi:hypothetical protein
MKWTTMTYTCVQVWVWVYTQPLHSPESTETLWGVLHTLLSLQRDCNVIQFRTLCRCGYSSWHPVNAEWFIFLLEERGLCKTAKLKKKWKIGNISYTHILNTVSLSRKFCNCPFSLKRCHLPPLLHSSLDLLEVLDSLADLEDQALLGDPAIGKTTYSV